MITKSEVHLEVNHNGALILSALVHNYLVTKQYYGYKKSKAIALFLEEVNK